MELIAFDLDGTPLNRESRISDYTSETLKELLGFERVIRFDDSDNDLSMFEAADEGYAPANANDAIKSAATAVIGHHDEEGIARFLRERFSLEAANE